MAAFLGVQETDMKNIALQSVNFSKLNIAMQFKSPPEWLLKLVRRLLNMHAPLLEKDNKLARSATLLILSKRFIV